MTETREGWVLTPEEEAEAIRTATANKNDHRRWLNRGRGWLDTGDVKLTDEEADEVLRKANTLKAFRYELEQMRDENRARRKAKAEALRKEWDYKRVLTHIKDKAAKHGVAIKYTDQTTAILKALSFRLTGNERYETECGHHFDKGLIISGPPGIGKSYPWQLVADNPLCPVQIITMQEVVQSVQDTGRFDGVRFGDFPLIYIDDVGTEYNGNNVVKHYGTEINWFKDFIEGMYAKHKQHLNRVIISTNDSFDELGKKYGFRVKDRLVECFDVLAISGPSFRGTK